MKYLFDQRCITISALLLFLLPVIGFCGQRDLTDSVHSSVNTPNCAIAEACYDIVYVRYPAVNSADDIFVSIPQGEKPYKIAYGADLVLLSKNGKEKILVNCEENCSVMDPFISLDGKTVFYSVVNNDSGSIPKVRQLGKSVRPLASSSHLYKIHLNDRNLTPIRLTYDDGFISRQYSGNDSPEHDQSNHRKIRDMSPIQLADGRILFTSNRSSLTTFHPAAEAVVKGSVQQLFVMDDHEGSAITAALSNLHLLESGNIHMVQHPIQLKDGRILFSTWQDAGTKFDGGNFRYAMTPLFSINPDGSNLKQFTEPHDHHKNVEHFISQLSDESVVAAQYYPSFDYGYGVILRYPLDPVGIDFMRGSIKQRYTHGKKGRVSFREFDRKGTVTLTPHTHPRDKPAPDMSGKYSMPSATANGDLLVAYSKGSVNHFKTACARKNLCEPLKSGIYLIKNATGNKDNFITDPGSQLILIKDDPDYNEIWPRAVLSYQDIHGQDKPDLLKDLSDSLPDDTRLEIAEAAAFLGTSSMYNREPLNEPPRKRDAFQSSRSRETHDGNWTIQGATAGVVADDIYAVRIVATPPVPYTLPIHKKSQRGKWKSISRHLLDARLDKVVARFGSYHGERWEILGEFPIKKEAGDLQGYPDTSWLAKIPSDTPTFIQTLDKNGMTIISELTWRALKAGESRTDCGGCHAHSVEPLAFDQTEAGKRAAIKNIPGVDDADESIKDGYWNLTQGTVPLLTSSGIQFEKGYSVGIEFTRDVLPIIKKKCISCHTKGETGEKLILDGTDQNDAWGNLSSPVREDGKKYVVPQISKYIRAPQARQSMLVWVVWGERLDGRSNETRHNDIDYPDKHPKLELTDAEKRTFSRWVDMGGPIDFPNTDAFTYTDDYQLPVVNIHSPFAGKNNPSAKIKVGFADAKSGLDFQSLSVKYYRVTSEVDTKLKSILGGENNSNLISRIKQELIEATETIEVNIRKDINKRNILTLNLPNKIVNSGGNYVLIVRIEDNAGNVGRATRRFNIPSEKLATTIH